MTALRLTPQAHSGYTGFVRSPRRWCLASVALVAALLTWPLPGGAQLFRGGVDLVVVNATVKDRDGRLVPGLGRDDFRIYEDGVEQRVAQFTGERVPVSLGIAVDISDSMIGDRIDEARHAIDRFVLDLLAENDEAFLLVFNHYPRLTAPWTVPPRRLAGRLDSVRPFGGTALYDALMRAASMFDKRRNQRCGLVVISDGADTASDAKPQEVLRRLNESDAFVFGIAIDAPLGPAISQHFSPEALREISGQTGGYTEVIHANAELRDATARIANELNCQYTLAFAPAHGPDGQYHTIRVATRDPGAVVRARRGYTHVRAKSSPGAPQ
jgi:Ca-activated chloride channel homolog